MLESLTYISAADSMGLSRNYVWKSNTLRQEVVADKIMVLSSSEDRMIVAKPFWQDTRLWRTDRQTDRRTDLL